MSFLKRIKDFFRLLFLIVTLPFELFRGKKKRVKKQIRSYFLNL